MALNVPEERSLDEISGLIAPVDVEGLKQWLEQISQLDEVCARPSVREALDFFRNAIEDNPRKADPLQTLTYRGALRHALRTVYDDPSVYALINPGLDLIGQLFIPDSALAKQIELTSGARNECSALPIQTHTLAALSRHLEALRKRRSSGHSKDFFPFNEAAEKILRRIVPAGTSLKHIAISWADYRPGPGRKTISEVEGHLTEIVTAQYIPIARLAQIPTGSLEHGAPLDLLVSLMSQSVLFRHSPISITGLEEVSTHALAHFTENNFGLDDAEKSDNYQATVARDKMALRDRNVRIHIDEPLVFYHFVVACHHVAGHPERSVTDPVDRALTLKFLLESDRYGDQGDYHGFYQYIFDYIDRSGVLDPKETESESPVDDTVGQVRKRVKDSDPSDGMSKRSDEGPDHLPPLPSFLDIGAEGRAQCEALLQALTERGLTDSELAEALRLGHGSPTADSNHRYFALGEDTAKSWKRMHHRVGVTDFINLEDAMTAFLEVPGSIDEKTFRKVRAVLISYFNFCKPLNTDTNPLDMVQMLFDGSVLCRLMAHYFPSNHPDILGSVDLSKIDPRLRPFAIILKQAMDCGVRFHFDDAVLSYNSLRAFNQVLGHPDRDPWSASDREATHAELRSYFDSNPQMAQHRPLINRFLDRVYPSYGLTLEALRKAEPTDSSAETAPETIPPKKFTTIQQLLHFCDSDNYGFKPPKRKQSRKRKALEAETKSLLKQCDEDASVLPEPLDHDIPVNGSAPSSALKRVHVTRVVGADALHNYTCEGTAELEWKGESYVVSWRIDDKGVFAVQLGKSWHTEREMSQKAAPFFYLPLKKFILQGLLDLLVVDTTPQPLRQVSPQLDRAKPTGGEATSTPVIRPRRLDPVVDLAPKEEAEDEAAFSRIPRGATAVQRLLNQNHPITAEDLEGSGIHLFQHEERDYPVQKGQETTMKTVGMYVPIHPSDYVQVLEALRTEDPSLGFTRDNVFMEQARARAGRRAGYYPYRPKGQPTVQAFTQKVPAPEREAAIVGHFEARGVGLLIQGSADDVVDEFTVQIDDPTVETLRFNLSDGTILNLPVEDILFFNEGFGPDDGLSPELERIQKDRGLIVEPVHETTDGDVGDVTREIGHRLGFIINVPQNSETNTGSYVSIADVEGLVA
jgi:hypothetical protein